MKAEEVEKTLAKRRSLWWKCLEVWIFTILIMTLPTMLLATEILFYFGTIYIDSKLLGKFKNIS